MARAGQPRDWMVAVQPEGTDLNLDLVLPGVQATLEHRIAIFDNQVNQLTLRANGLFTPSFAESQLDVDLRIVALTLGASVGVRNTLRSQTYGPGESLSIMHRLERDLAGQFDTAAWPFFEGRAILSVPLNDGLVFNSINRFRTEQRPDVSYDWRLGVVHDKGFVFASDNTLFIKNRNFGAIGPMVQVLSFDRAGVGVTQINWGLVFTTRPGLRNHDDLIFIQALFNMGGIGEDASQTYGLHYLTIPMTIVAAYRAVLPVWRPE